MTEKELKARQLVEKMKAERPTLDTERALKSIMKGMTQTEIEKALKTHESRPTI